MTEPSRDPQKAWAWKLKARDFRGDRLTPAQRAAWRAALSDELDNKSDALPAASEQTPVEPGSPA